MGEVTEASLYYFETTKFAILNHHATGVHKHRDLGDRMSYLCNITCLLLLLCLQTTKSYNVCLVCNPLYVRALSIVS